LILIHKNLLWEMWSNFKISWKI